MTCNTIIHFEGSHDHPHRIFTPARVGSGRTDLLLDAFPRDGSARSSVPGPRGQRVLLLALIARTTASGHHAALVDGADAFDPASAMAAGVDLSRLLWVKCGGRLRRAFSAADLLVRCPGFALVALDLGDASLVRREPIPPALCLRLKIAAEQSETVLSCCAPSSSGRKRGLVGRVRAPTRVPLDRTAVCGHHVPRSLSFAPVTRYGRATPWVIRWQL
jgi:hypothetical protein